MKKNIFIIQLCLLCKYAKNIAMYPLLLLIFNTYSTAGQSHQELKPIAIAKGGVTTEVAITQYQDAVFATVVALKGEDGQLKVIYFNKDGNNNYSRVAESTGGSVYKVDVISLYNGIIVVAVIDSNHELKLISYKLAPGKLNRLGEYPMLITTDFKLSPIGKNGIALATRNINTGGEMNVWLLRVDANGEFEMLDHDHTGYVSDFDITGAANIVTAVRDSEGELKLISFDYSNVLNGNLQSSSRLTRCTESTNRGKVFQVTITALATNPIVSVVRDSDNEISLLGFHIANCGLNFLLKDSSGGRATKVACSDKNLNNQFKVAVIDSNGNLKFIVYYLNGVSVSRTGAGIAGKYKDIAVSGNWVTAGIKDDNTLEVVLWGW